MDYEEVTAALDARRSLFLNNANPTLTTLKRVVSQLQRQLLSSTLPQGLLLCITDAPSFFLRS